MFYASIVFEIFAYKYDFFVQLVQSILKYNRGIYMQNVLLRLREVQPSLSSTERQIAQFILENPDETTTLTIRDLARRSFSSPSSVVRICRVIGFQGYKELRHALTLELATLGENGSHREKDITPQDSLQEIVDKVTHKNIQSLLDTQRLLLLDEPAAGMNPQETDELSDFIRKIKEDFKLTVFLIEHHMNLVMDISDRIYVLDFGKLISEGTPQQVQDDPAVIAAYLGVDEE